MCIIIYAEYNVKNLEFGRRVIQLCTWKPIRISKSQTAFVIRKMSTAMPVCTRRYNDDKTALHRKLSTMICTKTRVRRALICGWRGRVEML